MKVKFNLTLTVLLLSCAYPAATYPQATNEETMTITTYYPAPYGVYNELRSKRMAIGDAYYNAATVPINDPADLLVEGNVGIGTTAPTYNLHNEGSTYSRLKLTVGDPQVGNTGQMVVNGNTGTAGTIIFQSYHPNSGQSFYHEALSLTDSRFIFSGGNVGIGTTAPADLLTIRGSNAILGLQYTAAETGGGIPIYFYNDNGTSNRIAGIGGVTETANTATGRLYLQTRGSGDSVPIVRVTVAAEGNVGIGTMGPIYRLSVGTENNPFNVSDSGDVIVTGGIDGLWALYDKDMHTIMSWDATNDHMGIAGNSDPTYTLRVNGSIGYNGGGEISDIRYKKNIEPIQNALAKIMALNGVTFDWNNEKYPNEHFKKGKDLGLIAQEVEKVLPEAVLTDSQGYKAIEYGNLSALLVEGMKQQQKEIEELKAEVKELKADSAV